jgi:hypothetical protein
MWDVVKGNSRRNKSGSKGNIGRMSKIWFHPRDSEKGMGNGNHHKYRNRIIMRTIVAPELRTSFCNSPFTVEDLKGS